jgi:hypothetical protein
MRHISIKQPIIIIYKTNKKTEQLSGGLGSFYTQFQALPFK